MLWPVRERTAETIRHSSTPLFPNAQFWSWARAVWVYIARADPRQPQLASHRCGADGADDAPGEPGKVTDL